MHRHLLIEFYLYNEGKIPILLSVLQLSIKGGGISSRWGNCIKRHVKVKHNKSLSKIF